MKYRDEDIDSAVKDGVLSSEHAQALKEYITKLHSTQHRVDEEHFRLVTGFNDIFVVIASVLFIVSVSKLAGFFNSWLVGPACAAAAWLLSEYFVKQRRMALPAIVCALAWTVGLLILAFNIQKQLYPHNFGIFRNSTIPAMLMILTAGGFFPTGNVSRFPSAWHAL